MNAESVSIKTTLAYAIGFFDTSSITPWVSDKVLPNPSEIARKLKREVIKILM